MSEVAHQTSLPAIESASQVTSMFQVLERAATNPEVDVEKMERIYQMVERAEDRQSAQRFSEALVKAQSEAQPIYKSEWNKQTKSWYADIAKVCEGVNNVYNSNGITLSFSEGETTKPEHVRVLCDLRHTSGHCEQRFIDMPIVTTGIKGNEMMTATHGTASAFTYGRRYLIVLIANLPTPDNDGNSSPVQDALTITGEQVLEMDSFINENNVDRANYMAWLKQNGGYEALEDIYTKDFDQAMKVLRKARGNA